MSVEDPYWFAKRTGKDGIVLVEEDRDPNPLDLIIHPFPMVKGRKAVSVIFERRLVSDLCRDDSGCEEGSFCLFPEGQYAPAGICASRNAACVAIVEPVCGCDGKAYSSACSAQQMGLSVLHRGDGSATGLPPWALRRRPIQAGS